MQLLHGALCAEVAATGAKIKVIQMPEDRWPRIVQHPLNHACGLILVAAVGLIHRPHTDICLKLRLEREIFCAVCLAITRIQIVGEYVNIFARPSDKFALRPAEGDCHCRSATSLSLDECACHTSDRATTARRF